jgi:hypothetical protein
MATLQELEQAFIAADEAGNTEDAAAFAAEIERMRAGQVEQSQPAPQPQRSFTNPQYGQMKPSDLKSYGSGLVEGLQRVVAGGKQLYGAVEDYFTGLDRAGRGKKDLFTAQEMLRAATASAEAEEAGLDPAIRETAALAGQAGTLAVAPEVALPRATTVVGALAKNFAAGGLGGAFTFDPEGTKMDDTLGGAVGNAAFGLVPSLSPAVRNMIGRSLAKANAEGRTAARVAAMQKVAPNTQVSLAQRTGVPELSYLEHRAYNSDQVNFFADQTDQFIADAASALGQPLRPGQTLGADAALLKEAMDDQIAAIRRHASKTYDYGVSKAVTLAGPDTTIPIDNFREQIRAVLDDAKSYARVRETPPIKKEYVDHLESLLQKKSMTVKELSTTLKELTAIQSSDDQIAKALGTRLRNQGIEADLDQLQVVPQTDTAIQTLLDTRAEYRRAMQSARVLSDAAIYKLLDDAQDPGAMIRNLQSYSPGKQAAIRDFLVKHDPSLLRSLRQGVISDAVSQAGTIRAGADSQLDLERFERALFDGDRFKTSGLWGPSDMKRVDAIKEGLRVIKNTRPGFGSAGTPIAPEDIAINLVSRSEPFMARLLARAFTGVKAADMFIDPNVYKIMTQLNRSTTGTAANLSARAALMAYLQENYANTEEEQQ